MPHNAMYHDRLTPSANGTLSLAAFPAAGSLPLLLRRLPVAARALMIGAHPDDEDSALLAELALRQGVRAVYLSLTRGEGGQNRIGPETGAAFGILRTGELLASRRYDGAEQLLAPYIDFGYAKTARDVFARWGREHMIGTLVQAIREVQPDVLISVWTGTTADGHGHHQACGIVTREAFSRAADPNAFPEQLQAGLKPWQPQRLVMRIRDASHYQAGDLHIDTGRWDPVLGRSCFEIAMLGRSLHRSQNMGALQLKGAQPVTYRVIAGQPVSADREAGLFADLPLQLDAWIRASPGDVSSDVLKAAETATQFLHQVWDTYHPQRLEQTSSLLLRSLRKLREARHHLTSAETRASSAIDHRLQAIAHRVASAWAQACGIALEVLASQSQVVAGERFEVEAELFIRGATTATLQTVQAAAPSGWHVQCLSAPSFPSSLPIGATILTRFQVQTPEHEERAIAVTLPPWLQRPSEGNRYRFPGALPILAPSAPPILTVEAMLHVDSLKIPVVAPLVYRDVDPGLGEVRQPVRVRPAVTVDVAPSFIVMPAHIAAAPEATVRLQSHHSAYYSEPGRLLLSGTHEEGIHGGLEPQELGELSLEAKSLHTLNQKLPIDLSFQGRRTFEIEWRRSESLNPMQLSSYRSTVQDIDYPHIDPSYLLIPAQLSVTLVSVDVAANLRVGYVPGTGDAVPQALATLGIVADILDERSLPFTDLDPYDTIVIGVRALETRPLVAANRERLWQYARSGGTLIVQYQKPREDGPSRFVPFPDVSMPRPVPRVCNENAPVNLIAPDDPLLIFPNRISSSDFDGWVHERGLYFLATWPQTLQPLLECADEGDSPRRGGLMHARLGKGHYVYCAYALFRQLPAGVPGAYRLLANFVSLPRRIAYR